MEFPAVLMAFLAYCAMFEAIVSQISLVLVLTGIAHLSRDMLQNGILHRCACVTPSAKGCEAKNLLQAPKP